MPEIILQSLLADALADHPDWKGRIFKRCPTLGALLNFAEQAERNGWQFAYAAPNLNNQAEKELVLIRDRKVLIYGADALPFDEKLRRITRTLSVLKRVGDWPLAGGWDQLIDDMYYQERDLARQTKNRIATQYSLKKKYALLSPAGDTLVKGICDVDADLIASLCRMEVLREFWPPLAKREYQGAFLQDYVDAQFKKIDLAERIRSRLEMDLVRYRTCIQYLAEIKKTSFGNRPIVDRNYLPLRVEDLLPAFDLRTPSYKGMHGMLDPLWSETGMRPPGSWRTLPGASVAVFEGFRRNLEAGWKETGLISPTIRNGLIRNGRDFYRVQFILADSQPLIRITERLGAVLRDEATVEMQYRMALVGEGEYFEHALRTATGEKTIPGKAVGQIGADNHFGHTLTGYEIVPRRPAVQAYHNVGAALRRMLGRPPAGAR